MSQKPQRPPIGIVPHPEFIKDLDSAQYDAYKADPRVKVRSPAHFKEMQSHIKHMYHGVTVESSFVDAAGSVFDCIPIEQQPSLHRHGRTTIAKAPDISNLLPPDHARHEQSGAQIQPQLSPDKKDRHGNMMGCPPGTIPMRRLTLDQLSRYETLQDFFRKTAPTVMVQQRPSAPDTTNESNNHRYAYANQTVDNVGGHSILNVWQPQVVTPNQRMSLSQKWYSAGSGASTQTAEVGWQVLPDKYGHSLPVLFIYWTPDNYTTGNYNLDNPAFVQTNPAWAIGGALGPVSTDGAQQYEIEIIYYLSGGNWWLYLGGSSSANAVGYYPV